MASITEKRQKYLIKKLCDEVDDFYGKIGGYYYRAIENLKEGIKKAVRKNI